MTLQLPALCCLFSGASAYFEVAAGIGFFAGKHAVWGHDAKTVTVRTKATYYSGKVS